MLGTCTPMHRCHMAAGFNFIFNQKDLGYNHYVVLGKPEFCIKFMQAFPDGGE